MGIRFHCTHCDKVLNVKDEFAGRSGACPFCHEELAVPHASRDPADTVNSAGSGTSGSGYEIYNGNIVLPGVDPNPRRVNPSVPPPANDRQMESDPDDVLSERPEAVWFVRPPEGGQYGPASNDLMRRWISEARVGVQSWVWRSDWKDWLPAHRVFSTLADADERSRSFKIGRASSRTAAYLRDKHRRIRFSIMTIVLLVFVLITLIVIMLMVTYPVPHSR
jgi:hypothetical protein